jgi:hypothetical protein
MTAAGLLGGRLCALNLDELMRRAVGFTSLKLRALVLYPLPLVGLIHAPFISLSDPAHHLYLQISCRQFPANSPALPPEIQQKLNGSGAKEAIDLKGTRWRATSQGLVEIASSGNTKVWTGKDGLPILDIRGIAAGPDGRIWMATEEGAVSFRPDAAQRHRWFYFWGQRYLLDNRVENIVAEENRAWIRTRSGVSLIEFKPFDLEQKSAFFIERLQQRHNRNGFVSDCKLLRRGDVASCRQAPSDNDGLWTALCVAAECLRYGVTRSPEALRNARASLAALERLESITGIPGFPARALIHRGEYRDPGGEWHWTADGQWEWKGDTSSDELVGHFFAYAVAYDLLPDEKDRQAIRPVVSRIASHLLDHDLKLVGFGGRVTRWGNYSTEYFETAEGMKEAPLSSLELLSHLRVADHVTSEEKFAAAYRRLVNQLGYAGNVARFAMERPREVNYSDEELAFLSFYPLLRLEDDPRLRKQFQDALRGLWRRAQREENPLWDFIYAVGAGTKDFDRESALETLEGIPLDTISWTVKNSQRVDLEIDPSRGRFGEMQAKQSIPANERRVMKWNDNPYQLDGGDDGRSEDDGAFFLLPYWLGRYHNLLGP